VNKGYKEIFRDERKLRFRPPSQILILLRHVLKLNTMRHDPKQALTMGRIQSTSNIAAGWILLRLLLLPDASLAFVVRQSGAHKSSNSHHARTSYCSAGRIVTPLQSSFVATSDTKLEGNSNPDTNSSIEQAQILDELCKLLDIEPRGTIRLDDESSASPKHDSVRGVYLNRAVAAGNIILSVPIKNCLRDDEPPSWLQQQDMTSEDDSMYYPSEWATRLAASLLDRQQIQKQQQARSGDKDTMLETDDKGMSLWLSLLPDADFLRASLPVHWSEETLRDARCTALDLAVDSAYFARAEAMADLEAAYDTFHIATDDNSDDNDDSSDKDLKDWRRLCENALDIVQTRSCRVVYEKDGSQSGPPIRLLAPVFDLINHGGKALTNAEFRLEEEDQEQGSKDNDGATGTRLVVRATRDLDVNEQVLIDYGGSAHPAWTCLASYGFVPPPFQQGGNDDDDEEDDDEHVAEVVIGGIRYEVTPLSIPEGMVASVAASSNGKPGSDLIEMDLNETPAADDDLTPDIAIVLARRMSDFAATLDVLETEEPSEQNDDNKDELSLLSPEQLVSSKLASSLRLNQHRILIACSTGLREWAGGGNINQ
jgi:hypothetical protein